MRPSSREGILSALQNRPNSSSSSASSSSGGIPVSTRPGSAMSTRSSISTSSHATGHPPSVMSGAGNTTHTSSNKKDKDGYATRAPGSYFGSFIDEDAVNHDKYCMCGCRCY